MPDQLREEPEMATFVDTLADRITAELTAARKTITDASKQLEADGAYARPFRFLLAAEASLDHTLTALHDARLERQAEWSRAQKEALAYLEVRAASSGRKFIVKGHPGRIYRGLPDAGRIFRFEFAKGGRALGPNAPASSSRVAAIEIIGTAGAGEASTMPLQTLHRALIFGDVVEVSDPMLPAPALVAMRRQLEDEIGPIALLEFDRHDPTLLIIRFADLGERLELLADDDRQARIAAIVRAHIGDRPITPLFSNGSSLAAQIGGTNG